MGILDEAIREHLELKRQHGAADSELKQLEDEAFGPPGRPGDEEQVSDAVAEAPTEFMAQPGTDEAESSAEAQESRREPPSIADLQEPPPPPELPAEEPPASGDAEPAVEEHPAMEHEAVTEPPSPPDPEPAGPSTEERHAIAEQPTEMFDVEEELAAEGGAPPSPTDEELIEEEIAEPRLAPTDPLAGLDEGGEVSVEGPSVADDDEDEDDDFWDGRRLSDELDQALEAPSELDDEPEDDEEEEDDEKHEPVAEEPAEVEAERQSEDLLEETPDFLEEAPEDDQLWFEQKPPKDFDFDD